MSASPERRLTFGELADEIEAFDALMAMDEGEWTDEAQAIYDGVVAQFATKADAMSAYVTERKDLIARLKARASEAAALAKRWDDHLKSLESYVILALDRAHMTDVSGEATRMRVQLSPPKLVITDDTLVLDLLPEELVHVIPEKVEIDAVAVKAALQRGDDIPWAELQRDRHIRYYANAPRSKAKQSTATKVAPTKKES